MEIINIMPIIWKEDDAYISKCSELEIASVGNSPQESLENLREAVELYVENARALGILDDFAPSRASM